MSGKDDHFLIECLSDINSCIKRPLQQTLRIKFSAFDVSHNYLVFGASSGGLYVFRRDNYEFLKLIPSKEGAITKLLICPEEKYIVNGTSKGFVILVENSFVDAPVRYQLFGEHDGNIITDMIWHCNEVYCGDNKGKVSVISLNSLLSKAIFQSPTATLMQLDSCVCQLDVSGNYLLVSTQTKTFLCDTEAEHYRQIGKKLRDGNFGACFQHEQDASRTPLEREKNRFKILKEDEHFQCAADQHGKNTKIFCSRPGFRLWEATFNASVVCTYQLKTELHEARTESICWDAGDENAALKTRKMLLNAFENFGRLQRVGESFLLTFSHNNLVILDKQGVRVVFVYEMRDIRDVRTVDCYLYVWNKKDVRVVALMDLQTMLLKALAAKQYSFCSQLCLKFKPNLLSMLESCSALSSLLLLKEKCNLRDGQFNDIFEMIETCKRQQEQETNGKHDIVKVENGYISHVEASCSSKIDGNGKFSAFDVDYINSILYKQFQISQQCNHIETAQWLEVLSSKESLEQVAQLFMDFATYVQRSKKMCIDDNTIKYWCCNQYLKFANNHRDSVAKLAADSLALKYVFDAFRTVSGDASETQCKCKFPLPLNKFSRNCEFYLLAKDLYHKLQAAERDDLLKLMPLLWKVKISENRDKALAIMIQLNDDALLRDKSETLTYDQWNDCVALLAKLKRGFCLNCDREFDRNCISSIITWKDFAMLMVKRMGGMETTKLLLKYAKFIPNEELGYEFYQSCLFSAVTQQNGKTCDFMENVLISKQIENQFEDGLREYLRIRYLGGQGALDEKASGSKCLVCKLHVKNPILEMDSSLNCGHFFHKLCLESVHGICSICVNSSSL